MAIELPGAYSLSAPKASHAHHDDHGSDDMTIFGFWLYIMTDCILFASIFATYAVLSHSFAGGPSGRDLFDLPYVLTETFLLLFSSVTYGMAMLGLTARNRAKVLIWLLITALFGLGFIGMEVHEFRHLIAEGNGPSRSAYLSAFFTLVGTHGLHVTCGLIWMAVMFFQILRNGLGGPVTRRLTCLSLFWHFLDIVWICVFTVVYLMGVM